VMAEIYHRYIFFARGILFWYRGVT